jgi:hypothetical protein
VKAAAVEEGLQGVFKWLLCNGHELIWHYPCMPVVCKRQQPQQRLQESVQNSKQRKQHQAWGAASKSRLINLPIGCRRKLVLSSKTLYIVLTIEEGSSSV